MRPVTRRDIFSQAWPIILGQAMVPLAGIVDVVVIGRSGDAAALAGVALGVTVVNMLFWTFGFLRMGVTGLTAQAHGAGDGAEVAATLLRGLLLGLGLGLGLLLLSPAIVPLSTWAMHAPGEAADPAARFIAARLFGAPAALAFYAVNGWLLGIGRTRLALACQLAMSGANVVLDVLFVAGLDMGAQGVGLGTALAEWIALACGYLALHHVLGAGWTAGRAQLFALGPLRRLVAVNVDIMIRTFALLVLFGWFARSGARLGTVPLAANHVLMQLVAVSAFVLDGFAFTAEARVGAAIGANSRAALLRAIRLTGEFSLAGGLLFAAMFAIGGGMLIDLVTRDAAVRVQALAMLPLCALIPLIGVPGWLLDGIFIGATQSRVLRNAAVLAAAAYLATDWALRGLGNTGVWMALLASYAYRAATLGARLPALIRRLG